MGFNNISQDTIFYPTDVISALVTSIQTGDSPNNIPKFYSGHWLEIANNLQVLSQYSVVGKKFPAILLILPTIKFKEVSFSPFNELSFDMYIIDESDRKYTSDERLSNVFKTSLYPIYNSFMAKMEVSNWFWNNKQEIEHDHEDLYYLGAEDTKQNKLNLIVDAIYLSFKNINVNKI